MPTPLCTSTVVYVCMMEKFLEAGPFLHVKDIVHSGKNKLLSETSAILAIKTSSKCHWNVN